MATKKGGLGKGLGRGLDALIQADDEVLESIASQDIKKSGETILKINDITLYLSLLNSLFSIF